MRIVRAWIPETKGRMRRGRGGCTGADRGHRRDREGGGRGVQEQKRLQSGLPNRQIEYWTSR